MSSPPAPSPPNLSESEKLALVREIMAGGLTLEQACARYEVSLVQLKDWVRIFRRSVHQAFDQQLRSTLSVRGLDIEDFSAAEFSGSLADISVADLVQTIQLGRKDAEITITHAGQQSYIWCQAGEIIDAQSSSLTGEEAFYRILGLTDGALVASFGTVHRSRRISASTPRLLLDAAGRNDQRLRLLRRIGEPTRVFGVAADVAARQAADLSSRELAVLCLFDGVRPLEEVILAARLPGCEALEIAVRLYEAGVLREAQAPPIATPSASTSQLAGLAATYPPAARPRRRADAWPPLWVLVSVAVCCSSLGAITAIGYAEVLRQRGVRGGAAESATNAAPGSTRGTVAPTPLCPSGMVLIRGGRFLMGSSSNHPALHWAKPAHPVQVDSFCLGTHEVTVENYAACVSAGACDAAHSGVNQAARSTGEGAADSEAVQPELCNAGKPGREQHPINCVSYHQAARYCAFRGARLAAEAEWEYAARGDTGRLFPWGDEPPTSHHVNACGRECERWHREAGLEYKLHGLMFDEDDGYSGSAPVGSFPLGSTSDGVMDLIGNVFEWTAGGLYAYDTTPLRNPRGPRGSDSYVIRGGNFNSGTVEFSDPALRFAMDADAYSHGVGFRCAADLSTR